MRPTPLCVTSLSSDHAPCRDCSTNWLVLTVSTSSATLTKKGLVTRTVLYAVDEGLRGKMPCNQLLLIDCFCYVYAHQDLCIHQLSDSSCIRQPILPTLTGLLSLILQAIAQELKDLGLSLFDAYTFCLAPIDSRELMHKKAIRTVSVCGGNVLHAIAEVMVHV